MRLRDNIKANIPCLGFCLFFLFFGYRLGSVIERERGRPKQAEMSSELVTMPISEMKAGEWGWIDTNAVIVDTNRKVWLNGNGFTRRAKGAYTYRKARFADLEEYNHLVKATCLPNNDGFNIEIPLGFTWPVKRELPYERIRVVQVTSQ